MAQWLRFKKGDGNALTTEEVAVEKFGKPSSKLHKILRRKVTHEEALRVLIETYPEILPWKDWNPDMSCPVQNETFSAEVRLTTSASDGPSSNPSWAATSHSSYNPSFCIASRTALRCSRSPDFLIS